MKPRRSEIHAATDHPGIVVGGDHDDRYAWILRTQIHEPGESAHAGHGQIEQNEIDVATALEQLRHIVERPRLGNLDVLEQARDRFAQSPAKQRVVVRND